MQIFNVLFYKESENNNRFFDKKLRNFEIIFSSSILKKLKL